MSTRHWLPSARHWLGGVALLTAGSCAAQEQDEHAKTGSQTNWLRSCVETNECGGLECLCGVCLLPCSSDGVCGDLEAARCVAEDEPAARGLCGGTSAPQDVCLPLCVEGECAAGQQCVDGTCVVAMSLGVDAPDTTPVVDAAVPPRTEAGSDGGVPGLVEVDTTLRHQELLGFGAGIAYGEGALLVHPERDALLDAVFGEAGFSLVRIRNGFDGDNSEDLLPVAELLDAVAARRGEPPAVFINQGSPPAALKANGERGCPELASCTLRSLPEGGFDYGALADHWLASLEAYAELGVEPDFLSIQNNPNWFPEVDPNIEACLLLPEEGAVAVDAGFSAAVGAAGYREALTAVRASLSALPNPPRVLAPDTSNVAEAHFYADVLAADTFDVVGFHMYGEEVSELDLEALGALGRQAQQSGHDVMQTEMSADGLTTAVLAHHALTSADAVAYLAAGLVALEAEAQEGVLAILTDGGHALQEPLYALRHFARYTGRGWVRVEVTLADSELLASAWLSPDESALTLVIVNPTALQLSTTMKLPEPFDEALDSTIVERTQFGGDEHGALVDSVELGELVLPARSIVTIALTTEVPR